MIHVIGANGYIGTRLCKAMDSKGIPYDCFSNVADSKCKKFDLTSDDYGVLNGFAPGDVVVLLAAISSPDVCQNDYELAYGINVVGTSHLIDYCIKKDINVIFLSSDTVNGATTEARDEYAPANPFGNYAKMKYEIEQRYQDNPHFKTLRLSYVLSEEDKFTTYLRGCVERGEVAEVFAGLYRNVIRLEVVLEAIIRLCQNFHFNDYYNLNDSGHE